MTMIIIFIIIIIKVPIVLLYYYEPQQYKNWAGSVDWYMLPYVGNLDETIPANSYASSFKPLIIRINVFFITSLKIHGIIITVFIQLHFEMAMSLVCTRWIWNGRMNAESPNSPQKKPILQTQWPMVTKTAVLSRQNLFDLVWTCLQPLNLMRTRINKTYTLLKHDRHKLLEQKTIIFRVSSKLNSNGIQSIKTRLCYDQIERKL